MSAPGVEEALVLAGGQGTRLRAAVSDVPKPMAPITGRPFLEFLLLKLRSQGVRRVILSVGYRHEAISGHFGRAWGGMEIAYHVEETPLGTGGALAASLRIAESDRLYVLNGDTLLDADYRALAAACIAAESGFGLLVRRVPDTGRFGVCVLEEGRLKALTQGRAGEPGWINAGVYCMATALVAEIAPPAPFSLETELMPLALARTPVVALPTDADFIDIGVPDSFAQAQDFIPAMRFAREAAR